jgi:hypothetical protein
MSFEPLIQVLLAKSDQQCRDLSNIVKIYAEFIKLKVPANNQKLEDAPLMSSL